MEATYTHPTNVTVNNRFWVKNPVKYKEPTDLRNESGYSGRVEYLGDEQNHFSLRLSDVKKSDEHEYCIRVKGNKNYLYHPGIILRVTELRVEAPETVVEGNVTVLMCDTTCSPSDTPAFIWYKDDIKIIGKNISGNTLILKPTKAGDAGSYSCAVRGYEDLRSPAQNLSVKYGSVIVFVAVGLGLLALAALLSVLFWLRWRRQKNNPDEGYYQNVGLRAKDEMYAALDPAGRKPDDVYYTLAVAVT
ncbi:uncharacterized protein LOC124378417 isoform X2 [Silurus meridionalis]|nr:uncharacterized protein LOC124378417 isoform X2 [Silurus meridionalis]